MPMTKGEKAQVEHLENSLALRWPSDKQPAPMTSEEIRELCTWDGKHHYDAPAKVARGWFPNAHSVDVTFGCSDGFNHGRSGSTLQTKGAGLMFRTLTEAWTWIKHEKAREFARVMGSIERKIEASRAEDDCKEGKPRETEDVS
jgi:hypothetical protein